MLGNLNLDHHSSLWTALAPQPLGPEEGLEHQTPIGKLLQESQVAVDHLIIEPGLWS